MQLTQIAHNYLQERLQVGDLAIDATAGNGYDSAFCAALIAPRGQLFFIDRQRAAIEATRQRILQQAKSCHYEAYLGDHAKVLPALHEHYTGQAKAIIFNLGYLPGSDKRIQTQPDSTRRALAAAQQLLHPKGLLLVTAYRGHPGGQEEAQCVKEWMQQAASAGGCIDCHCPENTRSIPPQLWRYQHLSLGP